MNSKTLIVPAICVFLGVFSAKGQQDPLAILDGTWVSELSGQQITFSKAGVGASREFQIPLLGVASIRPTYGEEGSNFKVSGLGFDCFYHVQLDGTRMAWDLRSGSLFCPRSALFQRVSNLPGEPTIVPPTPPRRR
jgi:hypothetical protein